MPYTSEAANLTAQKIRHLQGFVEVPVVVENVSSYAEYYVSEMTEWEFLAEVVEKADAEFCWTSTISMSRPAIMTLIHSHT